MRKGIIILLAVASLFLIGCSKSPEVKNIVRVYNEVLIDAYVRPEPKLMKQFVTPMEYVRIESYILYLLKSNKILKAELKQLDFDKVDIRGNKAVVQAKERWTYVYLDDKTRKPVSEEYNVTLGTVYNLKKEGQRWLVDSLENYFIGGKGEMPEGHVKTK